MSAAKDKMMCATFPRSWTGKKQCYQQVALCKINEAGSQRHFSSGGRHTRLRCIFVLIYLLRLKLTEETVMNC